MKAFEYVEPGSVDGISQRLVESQQALPIAGGMDLLGLMKNGVATPERLVSLKGADGLDSIEVDAATGATGIGALVTLSELIEHPDVAAHYPALVTAAASVGTPQIRNRGTLGGNLCQRPRCWYFRSDLFHCLKKGGDACFAQGGDNRYHAILGNDRCAIVHPSSCAPALIAYDATISVSGPGGQRRVDAAEMFVPPEANVRVENILAEGELITSIELPGTAGTTSATHVVKHKQSHDWPLAIAAVRLRIAADGSIEPGSARVVMGAVAPIPWRSLAAESVLGGAVAGAATAEAAAAAAVADAEPMEHNGYKVRIAATAVKRAIMAAIESQGDVA